MRAELLVVVVLGLAAPACSRSEPGPSGGAEVSFGSVMADVSRRFELLGRASSAGRFELADYQLHELEEVFEESLPRAILPREGHPEVLPGMLSSFAKSSLPDLKAALESKDPARVADAFKRTATACNACHRASGHGFIEVPLETGRSIPNTDRVTP